MGHRKQPEMHIPFGAHCTPSTLSLEVKNRLVLIPLIRLFDT